jgi:MFS family permease
MKIDLAGPRQRGLAMGLNEFAGYLAVAVSAGATGWLSARYGLRPEPLFLGLAIVAVGLGLSVFLVKETSAHMALENGHTADKSFGEVAALASFGRRGLAAASRTGLVNNAADALAWGLLPLIMLAQGLSTVEIGTVAAVYPAVWGIAQLATGALSDRIGRRLPIAAGMWIQTVALLFFWKATAFSHLLGASALLGLGTALAYPALLAVVGDLAAPSWRAAAVGVYRTWRDGGYVVGAVAVGIPADLFGTGAALIMVAAATGLSGWDAWINLHSSSDDLNSLG